MCNFFPHSFNIASISFLLCNSLVFFLVKKGMKFIKENIHKLQDENEENMLTGFEVAFPSLIEIGRKLDIEVPADDSHFLREIYARRNLKLAR